MSHSKGLWTEVGRRAGGEGRFAAEIGGVGSLGSTGTFHAFWVWRSSLSLVFALLSETILAPLLFVFHIVVGRGLGSIALQSSCGSLRPGSGSHCLQKYQYLL